MTRDTILTGSAASIERVSDGGYREGVSGVPSRFAETLSFMTDEHHRVRNFAVRELPRTNGKPMEVGQIAADLEIPLPRALQIVQELEDHLFFLVRNKAGNISWAFPVTSELTPHRLTFHTGERIHGA